jgi:predicted amidophosphoribosyltransferase
MSVTSVARAAAVVAVTTLVDAISLGAPPVCAGCSLPGQAVCDACRVHLSGAPRIHRPDPTPEPWPPLRVATAYDGPTRSILTAWKERGRRDLASHLAQPLTRTIRSAVGPEAGPLALVPIPSSCAARRRRGEDAWLRVVRQAARLLRHDGMRVSAEPCLRLVREPRDQAGLDAAERAINLAGAMETESAPRGMIVIVDDIVTTGATMAEAHRALRVAGAGDVRAAAIAATGRTGDRRPGAARQ